VKVAGIPLDRHELRALFESPFTTIRDDTSRTAKARRHGYRKAHPARGSHRKSGRAFIQDARCGRAIADVTTNKRQTEE
jgi:hypothetical protein